ncbi:MAG: hypothetical protein IT562_14440 [Alphaproteobacteria bacterium]|nr:hypothetical protein [Alphaproteobacteria bacterium]
MKTIRDRRKAGGRRELRLVVPDARIRSVRRRIAAQTARLDPAQEREALSWIEAVSAFDDDGRRGRNGARR